MSKEYVKKSKGERAVLAICYDFDKTLTPDDMQAQGYIQNVGKDVDEFWKESNDLAEQSEMDRILSYMYLMEKNSTGKLLFNKKMLEEHGSRVAFFPGVEDWFDRTKKYGEEHNVEVEHYIISSGLKEMIEGTSVAKKGVFEKIYANSFLYDENGLAVWPAQVINYTNKTQFLFRIEKGTLEVGDDDVNTRYDEERTRVPFRNMVYIGDSATDIPCMKLVKDRGGYSIGVFNPEKKDKTTVYKLVRDKRVDYFAPADYRSGSTLDNLVRAIIERTAKNEIVEAYKIKCKHETEEAARAESEDERRKKELTQRLIRSSSFKETHTIIAELSRLEGFSEETKEDLLDAALGNGQIRSIIKDVDITSFYRKIVAECNELSNAGFEVKTIIESR